MKCLTERREAKRRAAMCTAALLLLKAVAPAYATTSQMPGLYVTPPDPNVMFTLDDSLSMLSDTIPNIAAADQTGLPNSDGNDRDSDALRGRNITVNAEFPAMWQKGSAYWSAKWYDRTRPPAVYLRSSAGNPLYYNPQITYTPWPKAGTNSEPNANANVAAVNIHVSDPFDSGFTRDLTTQVTESNGATFWPATYYVYKSTAPALPQGKPNSVVSLANFTQVIVKGSGTQTYDRNEGRTDCTGEIGVGKGGCSRDKELQNFANWLQYYRSRMLMAKGAIAGAFAQQHTNLRVGLASLNASPSTVRRIVKPFEGTPRTDFFTQLYGVQPSGGGTPLRRAMDDVGQYFATTGGLDGPWADSKVTCRDQKDCTCRRTFHLLSTDGFWNGAGAPAPRSGDNDNFSGSTPPKPGKTAGYTFNNTLPNPNETDPLTNRFGVDPFADGVSATLADVAAYYWRTDLRPDLENEVPTSVRDPAYWQHITTYTFGLGISGTGTVARSDGSTKVPAGSSDPLLAANAGKGWLETEALRDYLINNKLALKWKKPAEEAPETGDDLIHAAMNGRGRYFGASDPNSVRNGVAAALAEAAGPPGSMTNIATQGPKVAAGSDVYQATYNPSQWAGRLYAFSQSTSGVVDADSAKARWEASARMPAPQDRKIYTWKPGTVPSGIPFDWDLLATTQQASLAGDKTLLEYLRGSGAKELSRGGTFRDRARASASAGVLGDIVNGSPIKGSDDGGGYNRLPIGSPGQAEYSAFRSASVTTLDNLRNTIFLGANDGMLHAFNGADGKERFAYVPNSVFSVRAPTGAASSPELKLKMLSEPGYTHRYTVDGPPQLGDAYIGGTGVGGWRTVLVGSTGAGARSVFAIDVTQPDPNAATNPFAAGKVLWEFAEAKYASNKPNNMGFVLGYPHIARMQFTIDGQSQGRWVAIFGNGYDSEERVAKLFIVDLRTGEVLWDPEVGPKGANGLSQPNFVLNDKREVTAIYAGDLLGNLWKFDVNNPDKAKWRVAFGTADNPLALFKTEANQPITVMPEITFHPNSGALLSFGTGKLFETEDTAPTTPPNINLNPQAIYGVWDKPGETSGFAGTSLLVERGANDKLPSMKDRDGNVLNGSAPTTDANDVDWQTKRGWHIRLQSGGERVTVYPQQAKSVLLVATNRPDLSDPCGSSGSSRTFILDPISGGAPKFAVLDANSDGNIDSLDTGYNVKSFPFAIVTLPMIQSKKPGASAVSVESENSRGQTGVRLGGVEEGKLVPPPSDCKQWLLAGKSDATIAGFDIALCAGGKPRISWRQLK